MSGFIARLGKAWEKNDSLLCIGLDPEIERFPRQIAAEASPIFQFNRAIIDATGDLVCAYKPQFAHYAAYEAEDQLERTIEYIHRTHPDVAVILDAKRGDVGNTAERYAIEAFERYAADAVTVNPYLGGDALEPFLRHADKGVIILCRTSNPGAARGAGPRWSTAASSTRWWRSSPPSAGTGAATARWWSERPTRASSPRCARWSATCRCWSRASAPREAMRRRWCSRGRRAPAPDSSSAPRAALLYASSGADFAQACRTAAETLRRQMNAARHRPQA